MRFDKIEEENRDVETTIGKVFVRTGLNEYVETYGFIIRDEEAGLEFSFSPLSKSDDSLLNIPYNWEEDDFYEGIDEWVVAELRTGSPVRIYRNPHCLSLYLTGKRSLQNFIESDDTFDAENELSENYYDVSVPEMISLKDMVIAEYGTDYWEKMKERCATHEVSRDEWIDPDMLHGGDLPVPFGEEYKIRKCATHEINGRVIGVYRDINWNSLSFDVATGKPIYVSKSMYESDMIHIFYGVILSFESPLNSTIGQWQGDPKYLSMLRDLKYDYDALVAHGEFKTLS